MKRAFLVGLALLCLAVGGATLGLTVPAGAQSPPPTTSTDTSVSTTTATTSTATTSTATTTTTTTTAPPPPKPPPRPARLPSGVTIGGLHVGGLSPAAATAVLRAAFSAPLVVRVDNRRVKATPASLGARAYIEGAVRRARLARPGARIDLLVTVSGRAVRALVATLAERFNRSPADARLVLRKLRPFITEGHPGRVLDRRAAVLAVIDALRKNIRAGIQLPFKETPQKVTAASFGPVIVIRRESNRLYLYNGMKFRRVFGVATGSPSYPTPLGRFEIIVKWAHPWWYPPNSDWAKDAKPIPPGPGNPLGTRWMGISAPAVGIHGTPDAASIGYSASHGCIRMRIPEAEWLFEQVEIGTPVFIVPA